MNEPDYFPSFETIEQSITDLLHRFGVSSSNKGYHYLKSSITFCIFHQKQPLSIMNELYPAIAKMYRTTPSNIERCIRHTIETAFTRCDPEIIELIFGYSISFYKSKPTNSEFIITLSQYISNDILQINKIGKFFLNHVHYSPHIKA